MKKLILFVAAALTMATPGIAEAGRSSHVMGGQPMMGAHRGVPGAGQNIGGRRNWGGKHNGRWIGGYRAPGGWTGYRRPFVGYALPSYWASPNYYIGNYSNYGFSRPSAGYGWSRYYDDAVLTDRYGRVQDTAYNVDWDRYDTYDDTYAGEDYSTSYGYREAADSGRADGYDNSGRYYRGKDKDGGLGGALVGGGFGAIAGSVIGGRGNRTEGAIIGGVLGAATGAAIDSGDRAGRRGSRDGGYSDGYGAPGYDNGGYGYDDRYAYGRPGKVKKLKRKYKKAPRVPYDDRAYGGTWNGTWTGSYENGPVRTWNGTYEGTGPHWDNRGPAPSHPPVYTHRAPSAPMYGNGYEQGYVYDAPEITTVTVQSAPVTTTTTTVTEEIIYTAAARKRWAPRPKKMWRPKPRPRCGCQ